MPGLPGLRRVLHSLDAVPGGPGWNLDELEGLLPREARRTEAAVLVGLVSRPSGMHAVHPPHRGLRHHADR